MTDRSISAQFEDGTEALLPEECDNPRDAVLWSMFERNGVIQIAHRVFVTDDAGTKAHEVVGVCGGCGTVVFSSDLYTTGALGVETCGACEEEVVPWESFVA